MRNIEEKYLKRARDIHKEFLSTSEDLNKNQKKLQNIKNNLKKIVQDLKNVQKKLETTRNKNDVLPVYKTLNDLEIQYEKMYNVVQPLLAKVEDLRKEENILFEFLKKTYFDLKPEEIVEQVKKYVFKK